MEEPRNQKPLKVRDLMKRYGSAQSESDKVGITNGHTSGVIVEPGVQSSKPNDLATCNGNPPSSDPERNSSTVMEETQQRIHQAAAPDRKQDLNPISTNNSLPNGTERQEGQILDLENMAECDGGPTPGNIDQSFWAMLTENIKPRLQSEAVVSLWQTPYDINLVGTDHNIVDANGETTKQLRWTYSQLAEIVEKLSVWLTAKGCTKGKHLAVFLHNAAEYALFIWVAAKLRMPFIPLDPRDMGKAASDLVALANAYVLVVQDEDAIKGLENITSGGSVPAKIQIVCSTIFKEHETTWTSLPNLVKDLANEPSTTVPLTDVDEGSGSDIAMIVFTSGTTGTPKGCVYTASNLWSQTYDYDFVGHKTGRQNKTLIHTPVWHSFAINQALRGWREGNAIVFPSKNFDVAASLYALEQEKCTHMAAVPTLIQALVAHPTFPGKEALNLSYVSIGGTLIKENDVVFTKAKLGADAVIQAFGLTEGIPVASWLRGDGLLKDDYHPGVGKAMPGAKIRICDPDNKNILRKNETGELHIGGTVVIQSYYGNVSSDSFYTDQAGTWFMTGDQARIDENGVLHILGRYKDIIIRGGKNLVPAKIEQCIQGVAKMAAQVVGLSDPIAGELPVAVLFPRGASFSPTDISKAVRDTLGAEYALEAILTLEDLGLQMYPMTAVGKVRKNVLKEHVKSYFQKKRRQSMSHLQEDNLVKELQDIWAELLNTTPDMIATKVAAPEIADSITILRFCERVRRKLNKRIYLQDFRNHQTIEQQADLLKSRSLDNSQSMHHRINYTNGLPSPKSPNGIDTTRKTNSADSSLYGHASDNLLVRETFTVAGDVLSDYGFSAISDIEDIIPIKDSFFNFAKGARAQSWRHRIAFEVKDHDVSEVKLALNKALSHRPMFRTFLIIAIDRAASHVVIRPSSRLFDHLIIEREFDNLEAVQGCFLDDASELFDPYQMVQVTVGQIKNTNSTGLILTFNHSVFDALTALEWYSTLDTLIANPNAEILPQTHYKLFADMLTQYAMSKPATQSVDFHVKRLQGISKYTGALWPEQRSRGWMVGNDDTSTHRAQRTASRKKRNGISEPYPREIRIRMFPRIEQLRKEHSIPPSIVVKAALALYNLKQTGEECAIFANFDAARSWPWVPAWIEDRLPPAMSIDGPTLTWTMNKIVVNEKETVGDLFKRLKDDQDALSFHAHAPWFRILAKMREEAAILSDASKRQMFNWDLSLRYLKGTSNDHTTLNSLGRVDWPDW
jgi:acyl-CoA synthetase (AMP-forming)/AMP-acid ligase II